METNQEPWKYTKRGSVIPERVFQGLQDIIYRDREEEDNIEEEDE